MKCSMEWKDRLPIAKWLPLYSLSALQDDVIAGITVGLMVIPQGLAYAAIAELPPQYGLYSAFMGGFIYCIFGSSKDISLGPTVIMSLMVANYGSKQDPVNYALAMSFFCGIIWLLMGLLSLGFIVRVIPLPVISGFTSSAALIIACSQLKGIFGLSDIPREFFPGLIKLGSKLDQTNVWDLILGISCMVMLELLRLLNRIVWPSEEESPSTFCQRVSRKIIWLASVGRNALVVFVSALATKSLQTNDDKRFSLTKEVKEGLPNFEVPKLEAHVNKTNVSIGTGEIISDIGAGFFVIPLVGFLANIAIAQAFARRNHYHVDPSQELIALGVANIAGSFFSGYPINGSFSRTTVNAVSGVATPFGGVFTGCVVLLAMSVLTPFFHYIPTASLASITIVSVLRMVDWKIIKKIWKTNRIDLIPLFVTFFACFYQLEVGIVCGTLVALIIVLYRQFVPRFEIQGHVSGQVKLHGGLTYMGIEYFISQVRQIVLSYEDRPEVILIDCETMYECDFTVTQGLRQILEDCKDRDIELILFNVQYYIKKILLNDGFPLELFQDDLDEEFSGLLRPKYITECQSGQICSAVN